MLNEALPVSVDERDTSSHRRIDSGAIRFDDDLREHRDLFFSPCQVLVNRLDQIFKSSDFHRGNTALQTVPYEVCAEKLECLSQNGS